MVRIFIGLGVIALGFTIYCTVECIQTPRRDVRVMSKPVWILLILFLPLIGAGLWLGLGKARNNVQDQRRKGPRAPDDDPDFLRNIDFQRRQAARREEERVRREKGNKSSAPGASRSEADAQQKGQRKPQQDSDPLSTAPDSAAADHSRTDHSPADPSETKKTTADNGQSSGGDTSSESDTQAHRDPEENAAEENSEGDSGEEKDRGSGRASGSGSANTPKPFRFRDTSPHESEGGEEKGR